MNQDNSEYYNEQTQYEDHVRVTANRLKTLKNDYSMVSDIEIKAIIINQIKATREDLLQLLSMAEHPKEEKVG